MQVEQAFRYWGSRTFYKSPGAWFTVKKVSARTTEWLKQHIHKLAKDIRGCISYIKTATPYVKNIAEHIDRLTSEQGQNQTSNS